MGSGLMPFVTVERVLYVADRDQAAVLRRVHDGLVSRSRAITAADAGALVFQGGGQFALRGAKKAIRGNVWVQPWGEGMALTVHASDNAAGNQVTMLGFERRQYEATIEAELESIERDASAAGAVPVRRHA